MPAKKILIVEDNPQSLKLTALILKQNNYEVFSAVDGYQAVACVLDHRPDLVLLDINIPCGNGMSVHERITNIVAVCTTPIIYMSAELSPSVWATGAKLGAVAMLSKPLDSAQLLHAVSAALAA